MGRCSETQGQVGGGVYLKPFKPTRCMKASFSFSKEWPNLLHIGFLQQKIYFFHLSPMSSHLHPLQVENCDSNSRLVGDEDDNDKYRVKRVK